MFLQASDTTGVALATSLLMLAIHQDCQEKCYQELINANITSETDIVLSELSSLPYLEKCIKESMRLFPTVPLIGRVTSEPFILNGIEIPANIPIAIGIRQIHRNKEYWGEDALEYIPDRFNNVKDYNTYLAFSAGPRNCLGIFI